VSRKKKTDEEEKQAEIRTRNLVREIWGIVYLALGFMVLVSLVSHFAQGDANVLGRFVGTFLANGLVVIFGAISCFAFPALLIFLGISYLVSPTVNAGILVFVIFLAFELSVILGISGVPITRFAPNMVGKIAGYFFQKAFGLHTFGPYFLTAIALLITCVIGFGLNVPRMLHFVLGLLREFGAYLKSLMVRHETVPAPAPVDAATIPSVNTAEKPARKTRTAEKTAPMAAAASQPAAPGVLTAEDEAQKALDAELAEFRAKKNKPITISTADQAAPVDDTAEDDSEIDPAALRVAGIDTEKADKPRTGKRGKHDGAVDEQETPASDDADGAQEPIVDGPSDGENPNTDGPLVEGDAPEGYYKVPLELETKPVKVNKPYVIPTTETISDPPAATLSIDREGIEKNSQTLEKTLMNFGIEGKVVNVSPGPIVTRYEIELAPGIKVSRVVNLQDDISMAVSGKSIRVQAPIPGKAAIGVELPNDDRQTVFFKHILTSEAFQKAKAKLPIVLGRSISGQPFVADITKMPHLLIAGQTGAGKSVCINSFICSMLLTKSPEELRLILIDPKKVELSYYEGIPHLMAPVVTESKEAVKALQWGMIEMTRRYQLLARAGARNIESFNNKVLTGALKEGVIDPSDNKALPFIVIIVDELADLMLTSKRDVEASIQRIAQLARAVGMHLIVATQRPSVDVITGTIKANLASRIAFRTIQSVDSRTILGFNGAEKLLGLGDMLFLRSGAPDIERYHGAFISEEDVERVVDGIRKQEVECERIESFEDATRDHAGEGGENDAEGGDGNDRDQLFGEAARTVVSIGQGSTSLLQRRMKIGFARAGRLMDELERAGIVGLSEGSKAREVLVGAAELEDLLKTMGM